jgi:hypothetical protein
LGSYSHQPNAGLAGALAIAASTIRHWTAHPPRGTWGLRILDSPGAGTSSIRSLNQAPQALDLLVVCEEMINCCHVSRILLVWTSSHFEGLYAFSFFLTHDIKTVSFVSFVASAMMIGLLQF